MGRRVVFVVAAHALVLTMSLPALAQDSDTDRDRAAAERTLDQSGRFRWIGAVGAGLSLTAQFISDDRKTGGAGTGLALGGVTALGLGLVGDFARYRARNRLDALDRSTAGGAGSPARKEAEQALRHGRRLSFVGDVGVAMVLAVPFFPDLCGRETCGPVGKIYLFTAATAAGIGIVGLIKAARAESRLAAFDEALQASHRIGVAPLPDGVAANYSVAW